MLPSPFRQNTGFKTPQALLRERTAAVLSAVAEWENEALNGAPSKGLLSQFNPARGKTNHVGLKKSYQTTRKWLQCAEKVTAGEVLKSLEPHLYRKRSTGRPAFTRAEQRLVGIVPPTLTKGLLRLLDTTASSSVFSSLQPHVLVRGKVLAQLNKLAVADDFLVRANITLESIPSYLLQQACQDRGMMSDKAESQLRAQLDEWLDCVIRQPQTRPEYEFHGSLARAALFGYHAGNSVREASTVETMTLQHLLLQQKAEPMTAANKRSTT